MESEISRGLYKSLHLVSLFLRQSGAFKLQKVSFLASLLVFNIADSIERNSGFQETDQILISNAAKNRLVHRLFVLKDLVKIVWIRCVNVTDEKKIDTISLHCIGVRATCDVYCPYLFLGRYSEDLVKKRKYLLEKWINRVTRHPVLAQSPVFQHFITVCSETRDKVF